jgi:flagellar biosynthesis/type III secretory pathway protein FliH
MNMQRTGHIRGQRPARPGDLTAKISAVNKARVAAEKKAAESDPYERGFASGWNKGFDAGWESASETLLRKFREAGLDVDAVLALDDEDGAE